MSQLIAEAALANAANPTPAPWRIITKMTYFAGLIGTFGVGMLYLIVVRPVLHRPSVDPRHRDVLERRAGLLLALIGTWFLVALYFQIAGKASRAEDSEIPYGEALVPSTIWEYVRAPANPGEWVAGGTLTLVQYLMWAVSAVVLILLWSPRVRSRTAEVVGAALVLAFVAHQVTLLPTNFGEATFHGVLDISMNHLHVFAIATWVGGITGLVVLAAAGRRLGPAAGATWAQLWTRFSTLALAAVGCVLISGLFLTWMTVGSPADLFTTSFGRFLLVKVSLVAVMICIGGLNEFVMFPRIAKARAAGEEGSVFRLALRTVPALVAVEVALAVCVLFVLTFLTGSAREEAGDPDPTLSGGIIALGALLVVMLAVSFVTTAKLSERLSRSPLTGKEEGRPLPAHSPGDDRASQR
ncbi:copper resistance D family protein [Streptomyces sp. NPDC051217]|uniref:copper resistance D family protein n=1 Tax=Streptomyces sp. NPDC051217 TaxID=3365644 RepID=UPI00379D2377